MANLAGPEVPINVRRSRLQWQVFRNEWRRFDVGIVRGPSWSRVMEAAGSGSLKVSRLAWAFWVTLFRVTLRCYCYQERRPEELQ
jgi:hypothetical protein